MSRLLCTLLLSLMAFTANAAIFHASVDRSRISEGETIELTLETNDSTQFGKPDLQPLEELFEILGTRQVNRLSNSSSGTESSTRWIITLQPKNTGYVVVPPLTLGNLKSDPVVIFVQESSGPGGDHVAPVYITSNVDQDAPYVQAQTILTLRIYHSVSLYDDSSLTPLKIPKARVEQLGEPRTFETDLNGVRHGVIELRFAIFPQESGTLEIPSQVFSATTVDRNSNTYNPFGPRPGKRVRVKSPVIPLQVKAKPAEYPANAPWLPAHALSLSESWKPEPEQAKLGDSLTRSLTLRAEGLSSAQLQPLPATQVAELRRYPDQPQLSNQTTDQGIIGTREDREALVANREGQVTLPEVEVYWWNTGTDKLERTTLPARTFSVSANPALNTANNDTTNGSVSTPTVAGESPLLWPWQLSTAFFALTTLLAFMLWWRARRQPAVLQSQQDGPNSQDLLDELKRTCLANDSQATRYALDAWARQQPETLADMAARYTPLSEALDGLNGALYSESGQHWQGRNLWLAIRSLPDIEDKDIGSTQEASPLPPLYPR
ncbi:BatD family protein [Pseudomonas sp. TTU2014-080ASC]|uniref:BatD family protein n=1 Tax=Pseudomonas sp. TTU2014-080ASC TaxID=1729724 RepID=UPI000718A54A|nr:BatD family protein [Pseudomonas sp. TTU2014-080ASC]KRW59564.1 protein BatD [Pseudomonas sp. TTU2014-080ASC]